MKTLENILVAVDFSAQSRQALLAAADLSARYDANLQIVHAFEPVSLALPEGFMLYTAAQLADVMTELSKRLATEAREAEAAGAPKVQTELLQGVAATAVLDFARERGTDLIVMGTHGRTGLGHVLLGSVTERVLRKAPCPVLVVKA